jgi:hypothetical protein
MEKNGFELEVRLSLITVHYGTSKPLERARVA